MYPEKAAKRFFTDRLKALSLELYSMGGSESDSPSWKELSHKIDGFIEAGRLIQLISSDESQAIIDEAHFSIFGETREDRAAKKFDRNKNENSETDWDIYDAPAIDRKKDV